MPKSSPQKLAYMKEYIKRPEVASRKKPYNEKYYQNNRQMFLEAQMKCTYGPDAVENWHKALIEQAGLCKNCGEQGISKKRTGLEYDHDHITGKLRGLLCGKCNKAIGMLGDNEAGLLRALAYLRGE